MKARGSLLLLMVVALGGPAGCSRDDQVSGDFGGACGSNAECSPGARCLPNPAWPNGFCTQDCEVDTDCPSSAICLDTADDGRACLFECTSTLDCTFLDRDGEEGSWTCVEFTGGPMTRFACAGS